LGAQGGALSTFEAWICPRHGSNLCRFTAGGTPLIDYDPRLLTTGDFTGTPVLYPTPNRVRDGVFVYEGRAYPQRKAGKTILEHGLVHDEPWCHGDPVAGADRVTLRTWLDWEESSPLFEAFPFRHELAMTFTLRADSLELAYRVTNRGGSALPFGFGVHPYFQKGQGLGRIGLSVPATLVYEVTADLLPTGRLVEAAGTAADLHRPRLIEDLDLDHVYTGLTSDRTARLFFGSTGHGLSLEPSEELTHYVVYTPPGEPFFCVENQSCSTDAHNLHHRGYVAESGLQIVPAGSSRGGCVTYRYF
jgi:aldose 1-epimerase